MGLLSWFALTAALCFGCLSPHNGKLYQRDILSHEDNQLMALLGKRDVDKEGSCSSSPIRRNVTLKGGIHAGYFRKLAQYVAMQLCVELCCEEKGCDVAFMSGKNCYGVQCFSEELCQAIPTKKHVPESILISHVTIKGEGGLKPQEPTNLQCSATRMKVGVTLRGGLKSGNFTDVGKVDGMPMCTKLCCVSEKCDLALTINNNCFLVSCFSRELCQAVQAISVKFKPSIAYVMRRTGQLMSDTVSKLEALHTIDSKLMCKNSKIFNNSTLKGGYKAGNFTDLGKVGNMSACVRLCCGDKNCDAAFMLENNCYAITCLDEDTCTPVRAKKTSALVSLSPRLSYITSRSEEVLTENRMTKDGTCHAGVISYDVTLRGGMKAGKFMPHGKVNSMEICIAKCCQDPFCNAAMMLKDACFTVECVKDELCEKKPTPTSSKFNPRIAYVFRDHQIKGKRTKSAKEVNASKSKFKNMFPREQVNARVHGAWHIKSGIEGPKYNVTQEETAAAVDFLSQRHKIELKLHALDDSDKLVRFTNYSRKYNESTTANDTNLVTPLSYHLQTRTGSSESSMETDTLDNEASANDFQKAHAEAKNPLIRPPAQNTKKKGSSQAPEQQNVTKTSTEDGAKREEDDTQSKKDKELIGNDSVPDEVPSIVPGLRHDDEDPSCTSSETMHNVTLRGGIKSGKFKDRGKMEDFRECVKICCIARSCDLAFMLGDNCFSVECSSERLCEAVPARSSKFSPKVAYVYARTAQITKRFSRAPEVEIQTERQNAGSLMLKRRRTLHQGQQD